jgi:hypothetical protein
MGLAPSTKTRARQSFAIASKIGSVFAMLAVSGCASEIPIRPLGEQANNPTDPAVLDERTHALVFSGTQATQARQWSAIASPELTRRDPDLAVSEGSRVRLALDSWADASRDSLSRSRTFTIPRGHDRFIYFESQRRTESDRYKGLWHSPPRW